MYKISITSSLYLTANTVYFVNKKSLLQYLASYIPSRTLYSYGNIISSVTTGVTCCHADRVA